MHLLPPLVLVMACFCSSSAAERVIVVGAGFSGLAAATTLKAKGHDVVVLEARDRIGGRVVTDRSTGFPLDMGASWIHGIRQNPITTLARSAKAPLSAVTDYDKIRVYDFDGTPDAVDLDALDAFYDAVEQASKIKTQQKSTDSLQTLVMDLWSKGRLSGLKNLRELNYALNTQFEHEFAADASAMSSQQPWEGEVFGGGDVIFPAGYDKLPEFLAKGLTINLNTVVSSVTYSAAGGVTIVTNKGTFRGGRAIITVPVGVLRAGTITFSPALPLAQRRALSRIGMGTLNKVWMIFPQAFWDVQKLVIGYASEEKGHFCEFYNFREVAGGKALLGFNGGAYGEEIEGHTDQEIIGEMMAVLRTMYGDSIPAPTQTRITRWHSDPFSYGSYSFLAAGAQLSDRVALRASVSKRLFFAGEATHAKYPSTTHGAYLSGIRAANEVLAVL